MLARYFSLLAVPACVAFTGCFRVVSDAPNQAPDADSPTAETVPPVEPLCLPSQEPRAFQEIANNIDGEVTFNRCGDAAWRDVNGTVYFSRDLEAARSFSPTSTVLGEIASVRPFFSGSGESLLWQSVDGRLNRYALRTETLTTTEASYDRCVSALTLGGKNWIQCTSKEVVHVFDDQLALLHKIPLPEGAVPFANTFYGGTRQNRYSLFGRTNDDKTATVFVVDLVAGSLRSIPLPQEIVELAKQPRPLPEYDRTLVVVGEEKALLYQSGWMKEIETPGQATAFVLNLKTLRYETATSSQSIYAGAFSIPSTPGDPFATSTPSFLIADAKSSTLVYSSDAGIRSTTMFIRTGCGDVAVGRTNSVIAMVAGELLNLRTGRLTQLKKDSSFVTCRAPGELLLENRIDGRFDSFSVWKDGTDAPLIALSQAERERFGKDARWTLLSDDRTLLIESRQTREAFLRRPDGTSVPYPLAPGVRTVAFSSFLPMRDGIFVNEVTPRYDEEMDVYETSRSASELSMFDARTGTKVKLATMPEQVGQRTATIDETRTRFFVEERSFAGANGNWQRGLGKLWGGRL